MTDFLAHIPEAKRRARYLPSEIADQVIKVCESLTNERVHSIMKDRPGYEIMCAKIPELILIEALEKEVSIYSLLFEQISSLSNIGVNRATWVVPMNQILSKWPETVESLLHEPETWLNQRSQINAIRSLSPRSFSGANSPHKDKRRAPRYLYAPKDIKTLRSWIVSYLPDDCY